MSFLDRPGFEPWLRGFMLGAVLPPIVGLCVHAVSGDPRIAFAVPAAGVLAGVGLLVFARAGR